MRDGGRRVPRLTSSGSHNTTTEENEPAGSEVGPRPAEQPRRRRHWAPHVPRRRWSRLVAAALIVVLIPIGWSLGHALTMTGGGSTSERLAEWARDHYLGPLVTLGEWISYSPPKTGGKPSFALTGPSAAVRPHRQASGTHPSAPSYPPPPALASMAGKPLPGEGKWRVLGTVGGVPAHVRHLSAAERRLLVLCRGHRVDEPEPAALRAAARSGGSRSRSLEGVHLYCARHAPRPAGNVQRRLQD